MRKLNRNEWWKHKKTGRSAYIKMVDPRIGVEFQYEDTGRHCCWPLYKFQKQFEFEPPEFQGACIPGPGDW